MGYRSDVRVLLPEEEFNAMDAKLKALDYALDYDVKKIRTENAEYIKRNNENRPPKNYVYFGWDGIKWYDGDGYEDIDTVNDAINNSEDCHFVRFGEDADDFEETYNLRGYIDNIEYHRGFKDEEDKPPCAHCDKPFSESTLSYRSGELLINTSIDYCPKCGRKINQ